MEQISIYLDKFKNYGFQDLQLKKIVEETIFEMFGVSLGTKKIKINNGEISVKISGPLKSEIFIRKGKLIEKLNSKIKNKAGGKMEEIKEVR